MQVTLAELRRIADLARLELEADEETAMLRDLNEMLHLADTLQLVDMHDDEPMDSMPLRNVFREDEPQPSLSREALLNLAAVHSAEGVLVPKTLAE